MPIKYTGSKSIAIVKRKRKLTNGSVNSQSYSSSEEDSLDYYDEPEAYVTTYDEDDSMSGDDSFSSSSASGTSKKQDRLLMRDWIIEQVNQNYFTGKIPGLEWLDEEKTLIKIPWTHASRHGWDEAKDSSLFKEWAKHTGKYKEGDTDPDGGPKKWKANFRCAMNSLPDIVADNTQSKKKGHGAFKVYRLLPEKPRPSQVKKQSQEERKASVQQQYKSYATKADRLELHKKVKLKQESLKVKKAKTEPETVLSYHPINTEDLETKISAQDIQLYNNGINIPMATAATTSWQPVSPGNNLVIPKSVAYCSDDTSIAGTSGVTGVYDQDMTSQLQQTGRNENNNSAAGLETVEIPFSGSEHSYARKDLDLCIPSFVELENEEPTSDYISCSPGSSGSSIDETEIAQSLPQILESSQVTTDTPLFSEPSTPTSSTLNMGPLFTRSNSIEFNTVTTTVTLNQLGDSEPMPQYHAVVAGASLYTTNTYTTSINTTPSLAREYNFGEL